MELYNSNCLEVLKSLENKVDLICTDPPYRVTSRGNCGAMGGFWKKEQSNKGKIFEHNDIDVSEYAGLFYNVLKDNCHCYVMCNNKNLIDFLNEFTKVGFKFVKSLIWDKQNKICSHYYMYCFEYILMFTKGERSINFPSTPDILSIPIKKLKNADGSNQHDCEKPIELMKILIENSTKKGEIVLDPFMGIGSTCVASKMLERDYIGIEIDPKYFKIAEERLNTVNTVNFDEW